MGVFISAVRSYLERVRDRRAAADEPIDDLRTLSGRYPPRRPP
jgi:hypothetical protein